MTLNSIDAISGVIFDLLHAELLLSILIHLLLLG